MLTSPVDVLLRVEIYGTIDRDTPAILSTSSSSASPMKHHPSCFRRVLPWIVAICWAIGIQAQPAYLTEQLVAHYPFTNSFSPAVGSLVFQSPQSPVFSASSAGGIEFDGVQQHLSAGPFPGHVNRVREYSFTFFLKSQPASATAPLIYSEGSSGPYFGIGLSENSRILLGTFQSSTVSWDVAVSNPIDLTQEHWISVVFKTDAATGPAGTVRFYVDGALQVVKPLRMVDWNATTTSLFVALGKELGSSPTYLKGSLRSLRIYHRALSDADISGLHRFEVIPRSLHSRGATAVAQVVNGFVVGATLTDGGIGYTNTPTVTITGGGGQGAAATATVVNGIVTAVTIVSPGSGYTQVPAILIDAPPSLPRRAVATLQVINGFIVGANLVDGGSGYTEPPVVRISGGGGSGAVATAVIADGKVTGIQIVNPGSGFTAAPRILIGSPPFVPTLGIAVSRVRLALNVVLGSRYVVEGTGDFSAWMAVGDPFIAEDEEIILDLEVQEFGQHFRIRQLP